MFAGNFAPSGWMLCEGQLLPISENETLFQLIGTTYGGDGQETFSLPDLRGRLPLHQGNGFILAETGGAEEITLTVNQIPAHNHVVVAGGVATATSPQGTLPALADRDMYGDGSLVSMSPSALPLVGGTQPHENSQPYLCVNFIISLFGLFPSQT